MTEEGKRLMFHEWLAAHARGTLDMDATAALAELVEAVRSVGKAGKLVLEIKVEAAGSGARTVAIGGSVTAKVPQPEPELGVFYVGERGTLHRDDPYAMRLPGVIAPTATDDVRTVGLPAGEVRRVEDAEPPQPVEEP